mmetsp:Transcript_13677/g.33546  ORF Transcript_13677/g.33546 Transcript_13677/m.33546 type:complete len:246 (+) Transcript_13677:370-1107(+)
MEGCWYVATAGTGGFMRDCARPSVGRSFPAFGRRGTASKLWSRILCRTSSGGILLSGSPATAGCSISSIFMIGDLDCWLGDCSFHEALIDDWRGDLAFQDCSFEAFPSFRAEEPVRWANEPLSLKEELWLCWVGEPPFALDPIREADSSPSSSVSGRFIESSLLLLSVLLKDLASAIFQELPVLLKELSGPDFRSSPVIVKELSAPASPKASRFEVKPRASFIAPSPDLASALAFSASWRSLSAS